MDMYRQMRDACRQIGVKMLSDDTCCRLLAVVFKYGDESAVYSEVMRLDIQEARTRVCIIPGNTSDWHLVNRIQFYADQIEHGRADWLTELGTRYGVTFPELPPMPDRDDWKERVHGGLRVSPR